MIEIGTYQTLQASRGTANGMYLCDETGREVLLPAGEEPEDLLKGDRLLVFIYKDSEDRPVATRREPKVVRDQFARLQVREVTKFGAFLDWGLPKDLLAPFSEQRQKMVKDEWYTVFVYLDEQTERLVASNRLEKFLQPEPLTVRPGEEVELFILHRTELGVNVIINDRHRGLLFYRDLSEPVQPGERRHGYVKSIKEDNKIDVSLQPPGYARVPPSADRILRRLQQKGGFLALNDKSDPERIQAELQMSKKTFKKAIGALYKQRRITIEGDGIRLTST